MSLGTTTWRWLLRVWIPVLGVVLVAVGVASDPGAGGLFLFAMACTWWIVPSIAVLARRLDAMARPGGRAVNRRATPLLGGAAVALPLLGALVALAIAGDLKALGLALGTTIMVFLGAVDDIRGVRPRTKVLLQVLAGCCLLATGFGLPRLGLPGVGALDLGLAGIPLLLFWIVLATNAFNLIDGMDGLASSIAFLAAIGCVFAGAMPAVGLVVAGGCVGFLRHNLPPARIFLGDCGSLVLGFVLAALVLELPGTSNVPLGLAVMAYPLGDVTLAVMRRFARGKPLFAPDRSHIHHKAMQHLGSSTKALIAIVLFAATSLAVGLTHPGLLSVAFTLAMWGGLAGLLVWAGRVRPGLVLAYRRPLQRMYALRQYVGTSLTTADSRDDVVRALRHLAEALELSEIRVGGLVLGNPSASEGGREYAVPLKRGTAAWTAQPLWAHGILEEERQTITTDLLRQAAHTLQALGSKRDREDTPAPKPAGLD